jgi:polyphosphate kinase
MNGPAHLIATAAAAPASPHAAAALTGADGGVLAFQQRVLQEAADARHPLLERVKFLAIVHANVEDVLSRSAVTREMRAAAQVLAADAEQYLHERLAPLLRAEGISVPLTVDSGTLWSIAGISRAELRDTPLAPRVPAALAFTDLFAAIRSGDVLVHRPYESFDPIVRLLRQASGDPGVERIAITLYRTDEDSPVCEALRAACIRGVAVDVVVERCARRDEANNEAWAAALERDGARVWRGVAGLKVHAKVALIVRRESDATRRYVHVSSGNYHAATSRTYTDVDLLTCDERLGADVESLFDMLTGSRPGADVRSLIVAPFSLRETFVRLVAREAAWARRGQAARIALKMNALTDGDAAAALQEAARAGVRVDLVVRGACCLDPCAPGVSGRLHVRSIVGRFLEHSRAWYFRNGGDEEAYIGSADLMPRNFGTRIEVVAPVRDRLLVQRLRDDVLGRALADTVNARVLGGDGTYVRVRARAGAGIVDSQAVTR